MKVWRLKKLWPERRGVLRFRDLTGEIAPRGNSIDVQTRIAVDTNTGSVIHGSLQVLEQPAPAGTSCMFEGRAIFDGTQKDANECVKWLGAALALMPVIGANKSAGFGRVAGFSLGEVTGIVPVSAPRITARGGLCYRLRFDDPFLVNATGWGGNALRGAPAIPGSVVKAVLANALSALGFDDRISRLIIQEARPIEVAQGGRPETPPLSLYSVDADTILDARCKDVRPDDWGSDVIAFCHDWKHKGPHTTQISNAFPDGPTLRYDIRTRTAVRTNDIAETGKLFSYASVVPEGVDWVGYIWPGDLDDDTFNELCSHLPQKLHGIGKTKATACVAFEGCCLPDPPGINDQFHIVLETPAWIPIELDLTASLSRADMLRAAYLEYFAEIFKTTTDQIGGFEFYASQFRSGGYQSGKFRQNGNCYSPRQLTAAGSTFSFRDISVEQDILQDILVNGLPVSKKLGERALNWRNNPFLRQNGFGEVRITVVPRIDPQ